MGKRSRKRAVDSGAAISDAGSTRAERDAARRARAERMRKGLPEPVGTPVELALKGKAELQAAFRIAV